MRYGPVIISANGRIKPDAVIVDGKEERHPEGAYYMEWHEGVKRVRLSVGKDAPSAGAQRQQRNRHAAVGNEGASPPRV